ncbi:ATP-binding protein [Rubrobacter indicoceani]|uniref:ATP-binding protein n=1 Tax=Rubrobacter indicoceani TaxID=2051957 RepID=UPI0013C5231F|nr:ATP-binding protein [Rubrobacter indicoceani]
MRLPARPEYVLLGRLIVAHVGQVVGFGPEEIYDLKLAVTEAATNVIRHAEVEVFEIEYRRLPSAIEITVVDLGGGFDAGAHEAPMPPGMGNGIEGGLGLSVIRNLVDEVAIESEPGKTRLRMMRRAGASVEASSG